MIDKESRKQRGLEMYRAGVPNHQIRRELGVGFLALERIIAGEPKRVCIYEKKPRPLFIKRDPSEKKNIALGLLTGGLSPVETYKKMTLDGKPLSIEYITKLARGIRGRVNNVIPLKYQNLVIEIIRSHECGNPDFLTRKYYELTGLEIKYQAAAYWCKKVKSLDSAGVASLNSYVQKRIDNNEKQRLRNLKMIERQKVLEENRKNKEMIAQNAKNMQAPQIFVCRRSPTKVAEQKQPQMVAQKQPDILKMKW